MQAKGRSSTGPLGSERSPLWRLSGMGFELLSHLLAGLVLGWLVDRWAGTAPLWLLIGAGMGLLVGMSMFIRSALKANREALRQARERPDEDQGGEPPLEPDSQDDDSQALRRQ